MTADVRVDPLTVGTVFYDDPCSGCGVPFTSGDVALISSDATYFYCFACVTTAYEAMKAAQKCAHPAWLYAGEGEVECPECGEVRTEEVQ